MALEEPTTEYERRRLENIKRNQEMIASLQIHSKLAQVVSKKRPSSAEKNSYKLKSPKTTPNPDEPVVIRRSLRIQKLRPDSTGLTDDFLESSVKTPKPTYSPPQKIHRALRAVGFEETNQGNDDGSHVVAFVNSVSKLGESPPPAADADSSVEKVRFKPSALRLDEEYVARVVPNRIMSVRLFPTQEIEMVAVGNKFGNVGFWDLKSSDHGGGVGDNIHLYRPHSAPVSGILIHPSDMSKIYTSCYDGILRVTDLHKQQFDLLYSTPDDDWEAAIYSMGQPRDDPNTIYLGEGRDGTVSAFDARDGKSSFTRWNLHDNRINSVDFCPSNTKLMATCSTDGTACIWDLRKMSSSSGGKGRGRSSTAAATLAVMSVGHKRAVHSAYFSPSGSRLATTSYDDYIGVASGPNYENISMLSHNNQTGRWISTFKAIWGWDDTHIFVGNMSRGVDVLSADLGKTISTLISPCMTAIPCRFDAHPHKTGVLAAATSGGQVYIWRRSDK